MAASAPAPVVAPVPAVVAPPATVALASPPAASTAAAGAPPAAGILQLRSSGPSWVDVRDARGQVLLSRTVLPGESVGLDGRLPMRLVIGNAAVTQLEFRGQPVELAARTRDNIARVELQ
jgi:cytoskeleton protein RodZ